MVWSRRALSCPNRVSGGRCGMQAAASAAPKRRLRSRARLLVQGIDAAPPAVQTETAASAGRLTPLNAGGLLKRRDCLKIAAVPSATCHRTRNGWRVHCGFILKHENLAAELRGVSQRGYTVKTPLVIVLIAVVLVAAVSTVVVVKKACKSGDHEWCVPTSSLRHHIKTG